MDHKLEKLKEQYAQVPIPDELDSIVDKAFKKYDGGRFRRFHLKWISAAAAVMLVFVVSINVSPSVANAVASIPGVGDLVKLLTIREYTVKEGTYDADIKVPAITNLADKELESGLNEKYMAENKALYDAFMAEVNEMKKLGVDGHLGVDAGYKVMTDTDDIFAIARYVVNTVGSSSTVMKYDTIDKRNQVLLSLPMLFKDDRYVEAISRNIEEQMKAQMKADPQKAYWVKTEDGEPVFESFERIRSDQNFYINADHKLVISFDKYEVAPGYMGIVTFVIPTEAIAELLVSNHYVK